MADNYAPAHHQTTTGGALSSGEQQTTTSGTYGSSERQGYSTGTAAPSSFRNQDDTIVQQQNATSADDNYEPAGYSRDRLSSVHEPRTSLGADPSAPLASTEGPFQQPTTEDVSKSEVPPTSSVGSQNAPGRAGSIGENVLGALGYGGTHVERPKEEQGIGEKIVNFLGA